MKVLFSLLYFIFALFIVFAGEVLKWTGVMNINGARGQLQARQPCIEEHHHCGHGADNCEDTPVTDVMFRENGTLHSIKISHEATKSGGEFMKGYVMFREGVLPDSVRTVYLRHNLKLWDPSTDIECAMCEFPDSFSFQYMHSEKLSTFEFAPYYHDENMNQVWLTQFGENFTVSF